MVNEYYLAPGGKEYTITAGKLAKLDENSKVLDMACGRGVASINLVKKFGVKAIAVDINPIFIEDGIKLSQKENVADNIEFINGNVFDLDYPEASFDMIIAEGGALSYIGRKEGLQLAEKWLKPNGYLELSDMIVSLEDKLPNSLKKTYTKLGWNFETEDSYKHMLKWSGFEMVFSSYITKHYLKEYKENIKKELANKQGAFQDEVLRGLLKEELDLFYSDEWINYFTNIFIVSKKKGG